VIVAVEDMAENAPGTSHRNWNMEDPEALEPDVDWDTRLDWRTWLNFETADFFSNNYSLVVSKSPLLRIVGRIG